MNTKLFWITGLMSSFIMALCMSGILSLVNAGYSPEFFSRWMRSFLIAWPLALMMNVFVLPQVRKLATIICDKSSGNSDATETSSTK